MTASDHNVDIEGVSLSNQEIAALMHALRDRINKLEAIRILYGDASDEYADASNDLMPVYQMQKKLNEGLSSRIDNRYLKLYPDAKIRYSGPEGLIRQSDNSSDPVEILEE